MIPSEKRTATRDGFGEGLRDAGLATKNVIALCADLTDSTKVNLFREACPDRYIQMGVAEENMVGVAAGLALVGKIPVAASYAVFLATNALGPIRTSVCYSNTNVKLMGGHAGISTGPDGATHQALEDIAVMRSLPNMTVLVPCDALEAKKATIAMIAHTGPVYLRTGKYSVPTLTSESTPFEIGKAIRLRKGTDLTIIACGTMVEQAIIAADQLTAEGNSVGVINMHTIKPLDRETIIDVAATSTAIITIEEHQLVGGLGSAVAEVLVTLPTKPLFTSIGVQDTFGESGEAIELLKKYGLTAENIVIAYHSLTQ